MSSLADSFTYDSLNRLTKVQYDSGASITYSYDAAGNMLTMVKSALSAQTISFGATPNVAVGGTGTVSATASSGLPVTDFRSNTPPVCTVSGSTVSGVAAGLCTVAANQAGNTVYAPAPEALLSFSVAGTPLTPPGAPGIASIVPGPGRLTITVTPPSDTGGGPITGYTATCSASGQSTVTANSAGSVITVTGLKPGLAYSCTVSARNASFSGGITTTPTATPEPVTGKDMTPQWMLLLLDD